MINPKALETFGAYDKKSLLAGITVGQGLKGRARAPRNPAPAGFSQDLWDAAQERANNMIAALSTKESAESGETQNSWTFDKDAFCFGVAAGRILEGWEIDGGVNLDGAEILYYVHIESPDTVYVNVALKKGAAYVDWGDESPIEQLNSSSKYETFQKFEICHAFQSGDYVITLISNAPMCPERDKNYRSGIYGSSDDTDRRRTLCGAYLSGSVPYIGEYAFCNCVNLQYITIPASVSKIKDHAFDGNNEFSELAGVYYSGSQQQFFPISIGIANQSFTCATVYFSNGDILYRIGDVTIPDDVNAIGPHAFSYCSALTSVTIPNSVTTLGDGVFSYCSALTSVTIPDSVTSIEMEAFYRCSSLTSVLIPDGVTKIGIDTFYFCTSLTSVTIPNSVTSIWNYAFCGCSALASVTIPDSVTRIWHCAFASCSSLTSVTIPNSVTTLGEDVFAYCSGLTSITIPDSVRSIGVRNFHRCTSLTSVTIPKSVERIGDYAFWDCSTLTSVTIPNSVTRIGNYAFLGCSALVSATIPASVTSIGLYAFWSTRLTSVTISRNTTVGENAFPANCTVNYY